MTNAFVRPLLPSKNRHRKGIRNLWALALEDDPLAGYLSGKNADCRAVRCQIRSDKCGLMLPAVQGKTAGLPWFKISLAIDTLSLIKAAILNP